MGPCPVHAPQACLDHGGPNTRHNTVVVVWQRLRAPGGEGLSESLWALELSSASSSEHEPATACTHDGLRPKKHGGVSNQASSAQLSPQHGSATAARKCRLHHQSWASCLTCPMYPHEESGDRWLLRADPAALCDAPLLSCRLLPRSRPVAGSCRGSATSDTLHTCLDCCAVPAGSEPSSASGDPVSESWPSWSSSSSSPLPLLLVSASTAA